MFLPLYRIQANFRDSEKYYRAFVGGRGAGKSFIGAYDLLRRVQPDRTYLVGSPTGILMQDTTYPTLKKLAEQLGVWKSVKLTPYPTSTIRCGEGGATCEVRFRTAEDPERMRGPNLSGCWLDEASLMAEDAYKINIAALREEGEQGWLCLAGEEQLFDPVAGVHRRLDEIREDFHVYSLDPQTGKRVVSKALKPFLKGVDRLYRFHLSNGQSFVAPMQHHVLVCVDRDERRDNELMTGCNRPCGQFEPSTNRELRSGSQDRPTHVWWPLKQCVSSLPECEQRAFPSGDRECDRRYSGIGKDSQGGYLACLHSCGERLLCGSDTCRESFPSQDDVRPYILAELRSDGLHTECSDSRYPTQSRHSRRLSTMRFDIPSILAAAFGIHAWQEPFGRVEHRDQAGYQFRDSSSLPCTTFSSVQPATLSGCGVPLRIVSYEYVRKDRYYDLTVPVYENYEHCQLIHHNSATFTPKGPTHWTYQTFATDKPDTAMFKARTGDNPFLPADFEQTLQAQYGETQFARQELGGEFVQIAGAEFPAEWFDWPGFWFEQWPTENVIHKVLYLDPSKGVRDFPGDAKTGKPPDWQAFVLAALVRETIQGQLKNILYLDAQLNREPVTEMIARGLRIAKEFRPDCVVFEDNGTMGFMGYEVQRQQAQADVLIPWNSITHKVPKIQRMRVLGGYLSQHQIRIRLSPGGKLMRAQMGDVPFSEYDDAVDAAAGAIEALGLLLNPNGH